MTGSELVVATEPSSLVAVDDQLYRWKPGGAKPEKFPEPV